MNREGVEQRARANQRVIDHVRPAIVQTDTDVRRRFEEAITEYERQRAATVAAQLARR